MKNNKKWFALVIAMWIVIVISLIAYNILEYIIPFWREVKSIENSSKSYYLANSWIEEWLYYISTRTDLNERVENSRLYSWNITHKYNTFSSWTYLPPTWEWNSMYDINWNTISQWNPIQLSVWNWYIQTLADFKIAFKIPDLDKFSNVNSTNTAETLTWDITTPYTPFVNWQISSLNNTLNASWWIITNNDILKSNDSITFKSIEDLLWYDLNWNDWISIRTFYWTDCNWVNSWCTLKFSIVNKLELNSNNVWVPYLEWMLDVDDTVWSNNLPLRYTKIDSAWKSIWYKKELEIKVPTKTVNQAFDFTVFQ